MGGPEVEAVLQGGRAEAQIDGAPIEVLGLPDHATYRRSLAAAAIRARRMGPPARRATRLSSASNCRERADIGARRPPSHLPTPGGDWRLRVIGHLCRLRQSEEPGRRQCRGADGAFSANAEDADGAARLAPAAFRALITALSDKFGLDGRNLVDQATLKAGIDAHLQPHLCGDRALNAFTLGVAGIALLTSLLTLANSRLPQLAPLWAIGITRRQLAASS